MKEELIRIENGQFQYEGGCYQFDVSLCKGECIGIYVDEHFTSGSAYLGLFNGMSVMKDGKAFACGNRVRILEMEHWIRQNCEIIGKHRFLSRELTVRDYVVAMSKNRKRIQWKKSSSRLDSSESRRMQQQMRIDFDWGRKLTRLSMLEYYKLAVYKAWYDQSIIIILDRVTEILRQRDLEEFMSCVQLLLEQGAAVFLLDLDEEFIYRYANRVDVIKNRKSWYHLFPEEYDERLYKILGWESRSRIPKRAENSSAHIGNVVLHVSELQFKDMPPLSFQIRSGEIAFLRDENYNTVSQIRDCFLGEKGWTSGTFCLNGRNYERKELLAQIGKEIGIQIETPDRKGGVLLDNLTALDNLSSSLVPKAGQRIIRKHIIDNILDEASQWFDREELLQPIREWSLPERLRLSYYKWYLINPSLLICLFPFAGQEPLHHDMIIQMLVACAKRGMAVWIISSGIDAICDKTENEEFLQRLRYVME